MSKAKILLLDIETAPMLGYIWGLWDQNVGLNQLKTDWHLLSWSAKWLDDRPSKIMHMNQKNAKNIEDDSKILKGLWKLMDEADVIIWQNGDKFDKKKINARFLLNGMPPPSSYRTIDTLKVSKKHFALTSHKLEYMSEKLAKKFKKLKHKNYPGFELWKAVLAGDKKAWDEMKLYNDYDILALEEVYRKLAPWDNSTNFNVYGDKPICSCGSTSFLKRGFRYTNRAKFQRYRCNKCGKEMTDGVNLLKGTNKLLR